MNRAAVFHTCRAPYAYPVGGAHLRVVLEAAQGDLEGATCVHGDGYDWPVESDRPAAMNWLGDDGVHEYWGVTLPAPTRRVRYLLHVRGRDGREVWLNERGIQPRRPRDGHFMYAYIHKGDRFEQPDWIREAIFYQIFPDRFCNGNPANDPPEPMDWNARPALRQPAGGDLEGIGEKLGYIRELGINCIYSTPIFTSPSSHKYDTTDYYHVDPHFGTDADFKALVQGAHGQGIRFVLDAVFNHCGRGFFAFRDVVARGEQSPYVGWFYDLHSFPVDPAACNYETFANKVKYMPKLDTTDPECAEYLLQVAEHWIREADIDGWRLDVANEVDHSFWREFRRRVKGAKAQAYITGEVWHDPSDWLQGDQFDSVMNYPWRYAVLLFLKGEIDVVEFNALMTRLRLHHPAEVRRGLLNLLGSHDTPRVRTVVQSGEKAALGALLLLTAEGVPMIYYGDEIGMEGEDDPDCRRGYPWGRTDEQDQGLLGLYRRLVAIRRTFPWLNDGAWETFLTDGVRNALGYKRQPTPLEAPGHRREEEGLYVVLNASPSGCEVRLPHDRLYDLLEGEIQTGRVQGSTVELPPWGMAVLAPPSLAQQFRESRP